ncbi:MAG: serine/threonine-protein kinase, partial [Planctomycetota bacterium]
MTGGPPTDDPARSQRQDQGQVPTVKPSASESAHSSWFDDTRFTPGTTLAGRYRIVGRLGHGGMGEVYRADDLKLGQSVALKFLPEAVARDAVWLRRLHDEVRIAREVAHPNVCRVYDIGDVDGEHYITMEFVDGEDLSSLLRRIGRLPTDKAIQMARQLCAGLAAAHDKSVLHRDLKPANIMLDGRGHVRITDFGIAALAERVDSKPARAGTPAYMAPEQLAGGEVTQRSDIYGLGLVLYEIFTGREAFEARSADELDRLRRTGPPTTPSSYVEDMDPLVERVIMRCLENDPKDRPHSAIAVAAALPGGDPLAQALAAGETPSPEMIAEGGETGGLRPAVAAPCLAATVIGALVFIVIAGSLSMLRLVPLDKPPAVLADRAEQISSSLGYDAIPASRSHEFQTNSAYLEHIRNTDESADRWDRLATGQPAAIRFQYRSSPNAMVPENVDGRIRWDDPPFRVPGMVRMRLGPQGRLFRFEAVPPGRDPVAPAETSAVDWSGLFADAGLNPAAFTTTALEWTPPVYCDTRAAWLGVYPDAPDTALRIEAGAHAGRPVFFRLIAPWEEPPGSPDEMELGDRIRVAIFVTLFCVIPLAAGLIAWRHLRAGRGDRKGAARLALYVFAIAMGHWLFTADHVLALREMRLVIRAFGGAAGFAVVCWLLYLAIEPYARRYWPHAIISWTRLLAGRFRDPLVGRDILFGCLAAVALLVTVNVALLLTPVAGLPPPTPGISDRMDVFLGGRHVVGELFWAQTGIGVFIGAFVLLLLLRILLRRPWLANGAFYLILFVIFTDGFTTDYMDWIRGAIVVAIILITMIRFGLLSFAALAFVLTLFADFPTTLDSSSWYAGVGIIGPLVALALAGYGFWVALAGRPLFRDELA